MTPSVVAKPPFASLRRERPGKLDDTTQCPKEIIFFLIFRLTEFATFQNHIFIAIFVVNVTIKRSSLANIVAGSC